MTAGTAPAGSSSPTPVEIASLKIVPPTRADTPIQPIVSTSAASAATTRPHVAVRYDHAVGELLAQIGADSGPSSTPATVTAPAEVSVSGRTPAPSLLTVAFTLAPRPVVLGSGGDEEAARPAKLDDTPARLVISAVTVTTTDGETDLAGGTADPARPFDLTWFNPDLAGGFTLRAGLEVLGGAAEVGVEVGLAEAGRIEVDKDGVPAGGIVRSTDGGLECGPDCKTAELTVAPRAPGRVVELARENPAADGR